MSTSEIIEYTEFNNTPAQSPLSQDDDKTKPQSNRTGSHSNSGPEFSPHRGDGQMTLKQDEEEAEENQRHSMIAELSRRSLTDDARLLQTALSRAIDSFRSTMATNDQTGLKRASSLPTGYLYSSGYVQANEVPEEVTVRSKRLHKRIIVCCDGTWQNGLQANDPRQATNVLRLARSIFPEDRKTFPPIPQIVHYQTGLGTSGDRALDVAAGAIGIGISAKIREAYAFIAQNYIPGDEVFLFGFSRGAFTARTIASLISDIGILTNKAMGNFFKIFAAYQARGKSENTMDIEKLERFLDEYRSGGENHAREMPPGTLKCVGVWDTVGALGIPGFFTQSQSPKLLGFQDNNLSPHIQYAFHAMAIHETREDFVPTKWIQTDKGSTYLESHSQQKQVLKQVWFAGAHSDVGGGTPKHDLADLSLIWMIAHLLEYKLLSIDRDYLETVLAPNSDWGEMSPVDSRTGLMMLRPVTVRKIPDGWNASTRETVHASVERQHVLSKDLQEIFTNPKQREILVDDLLPFELEMQRRWYSITNRREQEDLETVAYGKRWSLRKSVVELLGELFHFNRDRLLIQSGRDSEELAQQALESIGPQMPIP
ncbi:hypothetical protein CROQUDRAFT_657776 [Cronartium quercuum f. sp. fusiforme G11]|uniref:T6SS Phospholipase effector Tle1-like catalytic domain-containing protein n=1 Tax=Cronartium quercuum f. sp. fusiforme G11 TaxID=708437 RepID=A0A9P6NHM6_9BASI|nr:hypothetical protein CROQUDRAFT_657776 [Cronartium quercuum f. sp. fusiforme G11]